ncbi:PREDICTED: dixin-like [Priapulus caudatus]|uniref:Dixin-like n=1 Tax=Priapulus caudatus TaxID=37621 RepID=A0ABM1DW07_PRICU|nr:PREDICTED: dixin-like [Priapulus caudatus]
MKPDKTCVSAASDTSHSWGEWTQQLQAYLTWVNSQLRKHESSRQVCDLRTDMCSGVALAHLVEVIAGEPVLDIDTDPATRPAQRQNVDKVLQFMSQKRVKMHKISSKEIVDGNLKAIMRTVLALAAHYKPQSIKAARSQPPRAGSEGVPSDDNAPHSDADSVTTATSDERRCDQSFAEGASCASADLQSLSADGGSLSGRRAALQRIHCATIDDRSLVGEVDGESSPGSPSYNGSRHSPGELSPTSVRLKMPAPLAGSRKGVCSRAPLEPLANGTAKQGDGTQREADDAVTTADMLYDVAYVQHALVQLRSLLITGDGAQDTPQTTADASSSCAQVDTQRMHAALSTSHQRCADLESGNRELQARLAEKEVLFGELRRDVERLGFAQRYVEEDRSEWTKVVDALSQQVAALRRDVAQRDKLVQSQRAQLKDTTRELAIANQAREDSKLKLRESEEQMRPLQSHVKSLRTQVLVLNQPGGRAGSWNSAPLHFHNGVTQPQLQLHLQELRVVKDAICTLRLGFSNADPQHRTVDALEQSVAAIVDRLRAAEDKIAALVATTSAARQPASGYDANIYENVCEELLDRLPERAPPVPPRNLRSPPDEIRRRIELLSSRRAAAAAAAASVSAPSSTSTKTNDGASSGRMPPTQELASAARAIRESRSTSPMRVPTKRSPLSMATLLGSLDAGPPLTERVTSTKILYYTDATVTPFMCVIQKPLGDVTLRDFKTVFVRPGCFRFHFKSQDPEFGAVKEEVCDDDAALPGWEGKVIAWVEEDFNETDV